MMIQSQGQPRRRYMAVMSPISSNSLNLKNPWLAMAWSFTFPGFGHFYANNYFLATILIIWEFATNTLSRLNMSIFYSLLGQFESAKSVVDIKWFMGYGATYIFCIWDSYRRCNEVNQQYLLTYKEDLDISPLYMSNSGINFIEKKDPWISVMWSMFFTGLAAIYLQRIPSVIFAFFWTGIIAFNSNLLTGVMYTFWGDFEKVKAVLDPQWLLYLPSMYGFFMYKAYEDAVEDNRVFKFEMLQFLRKNYQNKGFIMPFDLAKR